MKEFKIEFDELPVSVNKYLKPSAKIVGGRPMIHMYESKEAKDFKKRFTAYLKREVKKQGWNIEDTSNGHWYLDCVFYQSRTNEDNNNYYKILCDSLTGVVIEDDKNLLVRTQRVLYDSKNPHFLARLHSVNYTGIFNSDNEYERFFENNCGNCRKNSDKCTILKKAKEGRIQEELTKSNEQISCSKIKL